jgi:hypothetical protein
MPVPWKITAIKINSSSGIEEDRSQVAGELHLKMRSKTFKVGFTAKHASGFGSRLFGASLRRWEVSYMPDPALATLWQLEGRSPQDQLTKKICVAFRQHVKDNGLLGQMKKLWEKEFPNGPHWEFGGHSVLTASLQTSFRDVQISFSAYAMRPGPNAPPLHVNMVAPISQNNKFTTPQEAVAGIKKTYETALETIRKAEQNYPDIFARADQVKKQLGQGVTATHILNYKTHLPEHTSFRRKGAAGEVKFILRTDGTIDSYPAVIDGKSLDSLEKISRVIDFCKSLEKEKDVSQEHDRTL